MSGPLCESIGQPLMTYPNDQGMLVSGDRRLQQCQLPRALDIQDIPQIDQRITVDHSFADRDLLGGAH